MTVYDSTMRGCHSPSLNYGNVLPWFGFDYFNQLSPVGLLGLPKCEAINHPVRTVGLRCRVT